ncbi:hypothetical protein [Mesorhizobium japonicum]|uniref:hypothetical protein n=1 Tax=Mesorhizobium japonicum TaxID=2066070 RepID=UPI0012FF0EC3|nr:hypothetical protein [Mesorhizobium japonicum]
MPLLPILFPTLERNGHLRLEEEIRHKNLSISARTIDRMLQGAPCLGKSRQGLRHSRGGASKCAPLPTGTSRFPTAWKWTWSLIAGWVKTQ